LSWYHILLIEHPTCNVFIYTKDTQVSVSAKLSGSNRIFYGQ
jgi:hypothetical protein